MKITYACCAKEIEPLLHPFSFKGSALTCLWQTVVYIRSEKEESVGLGVQSVLWADDKIFSGLGEEKGNSLMFQVTQYAVSILKDYEFVTPRELFDYVFMRCKEYCKELLGTEKINETFVLNALVPVDNAIWMLYARENPGITFDDIMGESCDVDNRENRLGNIPLITYHTGIEQVEALALEGSCVFKIKIGSDPDKDGDLDKMLAWDKQRLAQIHHVLKDIKTSYTKDGHVYYYLDANCRYDTKERMQMFLDYAREIGAFSRVLLLEEPFFEGNDYDVSDLGVCVAADESIHDREALEKAIRLGYKAMTLKPIAKTLSYTLSVLERIKDTDIQCFCADLTVNPVLVEWNKNVAARLPRFPQLCLGLLESNGAQNYVNWERMKTYNPSAKKEFSRLQNAVYEFTEEYYETSGGIFTIPQHYLKVVADT